jgi:ABC-type amino acid transport substrate-binding protein
MFALPALRTSSLIALLVAFACASAPDRDRSGSSWVSSAPGASTALRVGIATNYPPVAFKSGNRVVGVEPTLADRVGRELERPIEVQEIEWGELIPALLAGRIDVIMSGMSVTPERAERVAFAEPYMRVGQMALIRQVDLLRMAASRGLREPGLRIGCSADTTGERFVRLERPRAEAFAFESIDEGIQALRAGDIDAFVHDAPTIWQIARGTQGDGLLGLFKPLTEEHLAWAVRKDDAALRRQLSAVVSRLRDSGELQTVLDRWIPLRVELK